MKNKVKAIYGFVFMTILIALVVSCAKDNKTKSDTSQLSIEQERELIKEQLHDDKFDGAFNYLNRALKHKKLDVTDVIEDTMFYVLVDNPNTRPRFRSLIQEFAQDNHAVLVRPEEAGQRITIKGRIVDETNGQALPDVSVELIQADQKGLYFNEDSKWNPRLFAYLLTDKQGGFQVETIWPGSYQDDDSNSVPSHIHFNLEAEGYRPYNSEFSFKNDSVILKYGNRENLILAHQAEEGKYEVKIELQPK